MLKRLFDILASVAGIILLSPLFIIIVVIIKIRSPGPIFYHATRVGRYGQTFKLFKFRSMGVNADKLGPAVTGAKDSRITPIGRFLRQTKLDELPQLLNVLRGEMSVVGPRPEDPRYVAFYNEEQLKVLNVRPGITSPASIQYRDEESILNGDDWEKHYIEQVMPAKLAIDLEYLDNANLRQDILIIFQTLVRVFWRKTN
jgi:lipopolysaccharide/colanic/teichoic acid biosynthesis glycosyltransferase